MQLFKAQINRLVEGIEDRTIPHKSVGDPAATSVLYRTFGYGCDHIYQS
jgi:hypothetical protein